MEFFRGKTVLLTGGSSGIGLACARILRHSGAHLVLVARNADRLAAARKELEAIPAAGAEIHTASVDVGDEAAVKALVANLPGGRPVDVLISNAGITMPGNFLELPQSQFDDIMRTNYGGAVHLTRAVLPGMIERKRGSIGYMSSLAGLMGIYGYTAYSASKFAIRGFAEALRCEVKPHGIGVTVCCPPDTDTPQLHFEDQYKPAETRAIAGNAKALTADVVAEKFLDGLASGKFQIVPGGSAKFADVMYRLFPGMVRGMFDSDVRKAKAGKA